MGFRPIADVQVIIPAKRLADAKSRLRPCLDDGARRDLVLCMLDHVVGVARAGARVAAVSVVTPDPAIARRAKALGARALHDDGLGLNAGLRAAMRDPTIAAARAWLVLPADLPHLTAAAVDALLARVDGEGCLAVAADQHATGTSALAWRGAAFDGFRFGPDSFAAHRQAGREAGFDVAALAPAPELFDLDDAEGLARLGRARARSSRPPTLPRTAKTHA